MIEKAFFSAPQKLQTLAAGYRCFSEEELKKRWSSPNLIVALGEAAINNGTVEYAKRCMSRAIEIQPTDPKPWLYLGILNQDPQEAIACYEAAIRAFEKQALGKAQTSMQTDRMRRAREGIEFEKKRMVASPDTQVAIVRVRQRKPLPSGKASKLPILLGTCFNDSFDSFRQYSGWAYLLGYAGTFCYKIRLHDGYEGYERDKDVMLDIAPREEPIDVENRKLNLKRSFKDKVLAALSKSHQEAIDLILKELPEYEKQLQSLDSANVQRQHELSVEAHFERLHWYERAGDIAYMNGDLDMAYMLWAKGHAEDKVQYLFARKPDDINSDLMKEFAQRWVRVEVLPWGTPDLYRSGKIPPFDRTPNKAQVLYAEEIAGAFREEAAKWEAENKTTLLDFLTAYVRVEARTFYFGFPQTDYWSQQDGYTPQMDYPIWQLAREWEANAENKVRRAHGLPLRGSLISETLLFEMVKQALNGIEVVRQREAWKYLPWLYPQHVDIFVPELNLGIEYQGEQHFRPIEHFGGEQGYQATVERDRKKRELFEKHGIALLYVTPDDVISLDEVRNLLKPFLESASLAHQKKREQTKRLKS